MAILNTCISSSARALHRVYYIPLAAISAPADKLKFPCFVVGPSSCKHNPEFEKFVITDLIKSGFLKYYRCYVDDILVLMKLSDIPVVLSKFSNFHQKLKFTADSFQDSNVHFFDLRITDDDIDIYRKTFIRVNTLNFQVLNHSCGKQRG